MAGENQRERLEEFSDLALFHATSTFDTWGAYLRDALPHFQADPTLHAADISTTQTKTCEAFNELASVIANDYNLGNLEDRLTALILIKVGSERRRFFKPQNGRSADRADHSAIVNAEVQKYLQMASQFPTDRDLCAVIQEDFARQFEADMDGLLKSGPQAGRGQNLSQPESDNVGRRPDAAALAGLALFGACALTSFYLMKAALRKDR